MPESTQHDALHPGSTLIPSLRYRDAYAAIDFLERAFGFTRHVVYPGANNTVGHAELRHGSGMIMLGSATNPSPNERWYNTPADADGRVTSPLYIIVPDCNPVWETARAAGAEVVMQMQTMDYGGQSFTVRDPEGYLWSIGEYSPWTAFVPTTVEESASNGG